MVLTLKDGIYAHVAFATDADGADFSTEEFDDATYTGSLQNSTSTEITDYKKYTWVENDEDEDEDDSDTDEDDGEEYTEVESEILSKIESISASAETTTASTTDASTSSDTTTNSDTDETNENMLSNTNSGTTGYTVCSGFSIASETVSPSGDSESIKAVTVACTTAGSGTLTFTDSFEVTGYNAYTLSCNVRMSDLVSIPVSISGSYTTTLDSIDNTPVDSTNQSTVGTFCKYSSSCVPENNDTITTIKFDLSNMESGDTLTICNLKFEEGATATNYLKDYQEQIDELSSDLASSSGLYQTVVTSNSGNIYYLHDKETLAESSIVWKMTSTAVAVSTDGGNTWNAGIQADGDVIANRLYAETLYSVILSGGSLNIGDGNFVVSSAGKLTAKSGTFTGDITGATGTFSGDITGATGTFAGNITADTVTIKSENTSNGITYDSTMTTDSGGTEIAVSTSGGLSAYGLTNPASSVSVSPTSTSIICGGSNCKILMGYGDLPYISMVASSVRISKAATVGGYSVKTAGNVQHGSVTFTIGTSNTTKTITFDNSFSSAPNVIVTPVSSVPANVSVSAYDISTTGFTIYGKRSDSSTSTTVEWAAVGD